MDDDAKKVDEDLVYKRYCQGFAIGRTGTEFHIDVEVCNVREVLAATMGTLHATSEMSKVHNKTDVLRYIEELLTKGIASA